MLSDQIPEEREGENDPRLHIMQEQKKKKKKNLGLHTEYARTFECLPLDVTSFWIKPAYVFYLGRKFH